MIYRRRRRADHGDDEHPVEDMHAFVVERAEAAEHERNRWFRRELYVVILAGVSVIASTGLSLVGLLDEGVRLSDPAEPLAPEAMLALGSLTVGFTVALVSRLIVFGARTTARRARRERASRAALDSWARTTVLRRSRVTSDG